jgi:hypothetical protein
MDVNRVHDAEGSVEMQGEGAEGFEILGAGTDRQQRRRNVPGFCRPIHV